MDWGLERRSTERRCGADDVVFGMLLKGATRVLEDVGLLVGLPIPAREWDSGSDSESEYEFDFGSLGWRSLI